jgi:hypothetical protein
MTIALFVFVASLYLVSLRVSIGPLPQTPADLEARDNLYFAIHGFFLVVAVAGGFSLGKWINGLGFAFAVLLLALTSAFMVTVQIGSYELACRGHNELVRHWQC